MTNIMDYIKWRGDLSFEQDDYNEIDILIFTQLSIIPLDDFLLDLKENEAIKICDVVRKMKERDERNKKETIGLIIPDSILEMFYELEHVERYKNLMLSNYINIIDRDKEMQISALTIDVNKKLRVVSFSGTDDTIIGWKENFNMMTTDNTSAQKNAKRYLEKVATSKKIIVCGHSKGGNLSVFSTLHSSEKVYRKIVETYSFDGPGISGDINEIPFYSERSKKCKLIIPQGTVIGALFEPVGEVKVVNSFEKGLYQHDAFSWEISGKNFVINEAGRTEDSLHIEKVIKETIESLDVDTRKKFNDVVFEILSKNNNSLTLTEMNEKKLEFVKAYSSLGKEDRKVLNGILLGLLRDKVIRKNLMSDMMVMKKKLGEFHEQN